MNDIIIQIPTIIEWGDSEYFHAVKTAVYSLACLGVGGKGLICSVIERKLCTRCVQLSLVGVGGRFVLLFNASYA